jgi:hypothetical protein
MIEITLKLAKNQIKDLSLRMILVEGYAFELNRNLSVTKEYSDIIKELISSTEFQ